MTIVMPRSFKRLTRRFYPDRCTVQQAAKAADSFGQLQPTWADRAGHVDIPCYLVAGSQARDQERKTQDAVYNAASHVIGLAGHYPTISEEMRAVVGGTTYDILLVENEALAADGEDATTRLICQVVR